ncbi:MAG: hypothetical protein NC827_08845 [Candidatus Omnitrophica bacterium]|nr:hypothetical protein [Candidatus Omnitrophota bacterium]MCM8803392.1 hypothetical protein [Candidatus Omnitrophota bacterium]
MKHFQKEIETILGKKLKKLQFERLKDIYNYPKEKNPFYKGLYRKVEIKKINFLSVFENFPFTKKLLEIITYL